MGVTPHDFPTIYILGICVFVFFVFYFLAGNDASLRPFFKKRRLNCIKHCFLSPYSSPVTSFRQIRYIHNKPFIMFFLKNIICFINYCYICIWNKKI